MNRFKIYTLGLASAALLSLISCSEDGAGYGASSGEGTISMSISISDAVTKALDSDEASTIMEGSILRISDSDGLLIRRYAPATEMPSTLQLIAGTYTATLSAGEGKSVTYNSLERTFSGESDFTISTGEQSSLALVGSMNNSTVVASFDQSVLTLLDQGYTLYVSAADSFDKDAAMNGTVPTLTFSDNGTGYLIVPDGCDCLSWGLYGSSSITSVGVNGLVEMFGTVEDVVAAGQYSLSFKYSTDPNGYLDELIVTSSREIVSERDHFDFVAQPSLIGVGFDAYPEIAYTPGGDMVFDVSSLNDLDKIEIVDDMGVSYIPLSGGVVDDSYVSDGVQYVMSDSMSGQLTITSDFLGKYSTDPGQQSLTINLTDVAGTVGANALKYNIEGFDISPIVVDWWLNTTTIKATVNGHDDSDMVIVYRKSSDAEWIEASTVRDGTSNLVGNIAPTWTTSKSVGEQNVYIPSTGGLFAGSDYEYAVKVDNEIYTPLGVKTIAKVEVDVIPDGTIENSSMLCFGSEKSGSSTEWGSGNNTYISTLCTYEERESGSGNHVAKLLSGYGSLWGLGATFAAGNMFFGQFELDGTSGSVSFGQKFDWSVRPRSFKVDYAAAMAAVTDTSSSAPLGTYDEARIYVAIVDWSSRHVVTAGVNSTCWDPTKSSYLSEGQVIAYASVYITDREDTGMKTLEIPFEYYDKVTQPSASSYSLVISCASSAYGDYFAGGSGSVLYVDNFEFGY